MINNIDPNETRKTMIVILLFINCCTVVLYSFEIDFLFLSLVTTTILLTIQYIMDSMEEKVQPLIQSNKYAKKLDGMVKKNG